MMSSDIQEAQSVNALVNTSAVDSGATTTQATVAGDVAGAATLVAGVVL